MSLPALSPEENQHLNDTRQPALWGCLGVFLAICNVAIVGRLWGTRTSIGDRSRVLTEDILIVLSGIFVNVIIANLMVATHYGLGLHVYTINARDPEYPTNLSNTFRHVWITMVLMGPCFTCIKLTLLFFYKRLFLVSNSKLRIFWWANLIYTVLWFIGATGFYLFQCWPVQWYYVRYFAKYPHLPVPGNMTGQCDATSVLHVSLPPIFSLASDIALLILPIWAISKLRLSKTKKRGLMVVFGIGIAACMLELARVLVLLLDTDDATDPSYGVAVFLVLTAAEETLAVVCACVPVLVPQLVKSYKGRARNNTYASDRNGDHNSSDRRSSRGFKRIHHLWTIPTTIDGTKADVTIHDDYIPLTDIDITRDGTPKHGDQHRTSEYITHQRCDREGDPQNQTARSRVASYPHSINQTEWVQKPSTPPPGDIHVRTDIQVQVGSAN
ncbi:hypothetical protein F5Y04DRAFT_291085 [Hypomontagnella monticulosa]|nr:hypothetical protein F5Y04DRAFT_291085 [Hypomontagnella monticulosa]